MGPYFVALVHSLYRTLSHRQAENRCYRPKRDRELARGNEAPPDVRESDPRSSGLLARTVRSRGVVTGMWRAGWMKRRTWRRWRCGDIGVEGRRTWTWTTARRGRLPGRRAARTSVAWGGRRKARGENRVTVARTAGDQPLNTRRSSCHARFMGRQRNHTSTRNFPSLALCPSPYTPYTAPLGAGPRCDAHSNSIRTE